jgi:hypothetical protein
MGHGGKREGAGRKRGIGNLLTEELREKINAERLIQFLQDLAEGKIDGASLTERKDAATTLLKKVLPDMNAQKIEAHAALANVERISWGHPK